MRENPNEFSSANDEITLKEFAAKLRFWWSYLLSKWYIFLITGIVCAGIGILYAYLQKAKYTATLTFAPEGKGMGQLGAYVGIASQFGVDLGIGGDAFEGDNLAEIMMSKKIIEKSLFTEVPVEDHKILLINLYIQSNKLDKSWSKNPRLSSIKFNAKNERGPRAKDSLLNKIITDVRKQVTVSKIDKKINIFAVEITDQSEDFAANFVKELTNNTIDYYVNYSVGKSRSNIVILQHQVDSVRNLLNGNIVQVAAMSDININPTRQIVKTGVVRKQVDVQANGAIYVELLKQLEIAKITLRHETPLIQVIDEPRIPLEKIKLGRLKGGLIFGILGVVFCFFYLVIRRLLS